MHKSYNQITKLSSLIDEYDVFLFDIWGVLHEGGTVYKGVPELFNMIALKKIVRIISNAPRLKETTAKSLTSQGINIDPKNIMTSGEVARVMMQTSAHYLGIADPVIYHIGRQRNEEILNGIPCTQTEDISKANLVLLTAYRDFDEVDGDITSDLETARNMGLTVLCANPDHEVLHMGQLRRCAGYFAQEYETAGGKVIYSGKPGKIIFDECFKSFDHSGKKMIMIGDTFDTDIEGADNARIDSGLVLTGNMGLLMKKLDGADMLSSANSICAARGARPTYLVSME